MRLRDTTPWLQPNQATSPGIVNRQLITGNWPLTLTLTLGPVIDFFSSDLRLEPMNITDLTQRPPRSPRLKLGGYVILPRMLDKGRAELSGKAGEYHFACPLDQRFLSFTGLASDDILRLLKEGKSDSDVLAWIREHAKQNDWEIFSWSEYHLRRGPSDNESRQYFNETLQKIAPERDDVATWFDLLDLDDFASFGGLA